ncbi:MAG: hypothetical protein KJ955_02360 [Nanoarchaeota archaeon]|nr:hypothetical protein [Nanoarchaeota archaeon]
MDWERFVRIFAILHTACSAKPEFGQCKGTSIEIVKKLGEYRLEAELLHLPKQSHFVAGCEGLIIDATLDINYETKTGRRVFTRQEHISLMKEVAAKEPFNAYMADEVIYKPVEF